jgi:hypothetical protein
MEKLLKEAKETKQKRDKEEREAMLRKQLN